MDDLSAMPVAALSPSLRALLEAYGFDEATFASLRERLRQGTAGELQNRRTSPLSPPLTDDIVALPALASVEREALAMRGREQLARGAWAVIILAGGMATRFGGVVKASVEALPGQSFLDLKLLDVRQLAELCETTIPVYLMTSFATDASLRTLVSSLSSPRVPVHTFAQFVSLRLTPDGELFRDAAGEPSPYAPGHGDFAPALRARGVLRQLLERGVEYVAMTNIDNLAATLDPALLALHVASRRDMTFEVVRRDDADQGGTPARVDGVLQVIEGLREPAGFERSSIPWFSTNCLYFNLRALDRDFALDWFAVAKRSDGRVAIQFERLVNQLSAFLTSQALSVERDGPDARFLPVKDPAELARHRDQIASILSRRGITLAP